MKLIYCILSVLILISHLIQNNYIRLSHYRYYPEGGRYSVVKTFTYSGRFISEENQDPEENIL